LAVAPIPYLSSNQITYVSFLLSSYQRWTGYALIDSALTLTQQAEALYHAPFVVVSHNTLADPVFCYANITAQTLWNLSWEQFTQLPSRLSAQEDAQGERERLLERATRDGYVDDYQGVRVTSDGKRFKIADCVLWNVVDDHDLKIGQAATFSSWEWLTK